MNAKPKIREKIREAPARRFFGYYPGTVAVVTAATADDRNLMSAGWHTALSAVPPLYGVAIGAERFTHALITAAGSFGVNFLPFEAAELVAAAGSVSRRSGEDKFARFAIEAEAPLATTAPVLTCAYLSYECEVVDVRRTGDHDLFVGEVKAVHYAPDAYDDTWLFRGAVRGAGGAATLYYGRGEYQAVGSSSRAVFPPERFKP